jgi:protein-tyrosine-phosphatase
MTATHGSDLATDAPNVLFVCRHGAARSPMAAGLMRQLAEDRVAVLSAGIEPADTLDARVVAAMAERGIDLSQETPGPCTDDALRAADVVVTMACADVCPVIPGRRYIDWPFEDPVGETVSAIRPLRDDIERRVRELLDELGVDAAQSGLGSA